MCSFSLFGTTSSSSSSCHARHARCQGTSPYFARTQRSTARSHHLCLCDGWRGKFPFCLFRSITSAYDSFVLSQLSLMSALAAGSLVQSHLAHNRSGEFLFSLISREFQANRPLCTAPATPALPTPSISRPTTPGAPATRISALTPAVGSTGRD